MNEITKVVNNLVNHMQHSGCILVATNQETIYQHCLGYADISKKIPVSMDTQFLAGSVKKQFTAVAMLKAFLDKFLNESDTEQLQVYIQAELNKTIENFLSADHEVWNGSMPAWARTVTIHQLLVHSSGIKNYTSLPDYEKQTFPKHSDLISYFK